MIDQTSLDYRSDRQIRPAADFRLLFISILSGIIGIGAGFIAFVLYSCISFFTNLFFFQRLSFEPVSPAQNQLGLWVIIVPAVGGLMIGLLSKYGTPKIRGHGIPEAMEAVLFNRSRIAPRVAILKPLSAAIAIGSGGPFGAEGPIIQTGGAFGSLIGQLIHTTAAERKVLLACGAAAGMAATFGTPIAAVILTIELLLFEFKSRSFIPLVIASTLATSMHSLLFGPGPMFSVNVSDFGIPAQLPLYVTLGLLCGLGAIFFSHSLYWFEDQFARLPINELWWPAIGGIGLGIIGFFVPRVLGIGYSTLSDILNNQLPLQVLVSVLIFKALALFISLGSGTSGGLLAPMLICGSALGAIFAIVVNRLVPGAHLDPSAYALVAMAAMFGAASRATFAFIVFAFEITRDYNAILPLMLVGVIADGVAIVFMRNSIMTEKLARRGLRVHQDYETDVMQQVTVGEVMAQDTPTIPSTTRISDLAEQIARNDPSLAQHQALPILDEQGQLVGIITRGDVLRALDDDANGDRSVLEAGSDNLIVAYPDEPVNIAVDRMLQYNIGRLPVVSRTDSHHMVGYLGRSGVLQARLHRHQEEAVREPGWLTRFAQPTKSS